MQRERISTKNLEQKKLDKSFELICMFLSKISN